MHRQQQSGGLWGLSLVVLVLSLWLAGRGVEGGLLEEKITVQVNSVDKKSEGPVFEPLPCTVTETSGVVPCDTNPKCCKKGSPRVPGTDYCCPPGSHQYHFNKGKDFICACAV